jgi:hypothetical protein
MKRDCWLDPYGQVYYCKEFGHDDAAQEILKNEFPMDGHTPIGFETWEERGFSNSFTETLEKRGWIQFSTTIDRWGCEHIIGYEDNHPRPTSAQIDKMYELTGFYYDDDSSWSKFFNFEEE